MRKRVAILIAAAVTLAVPQFALANASNGQSPVPMQGAFTHWESMGSAGPAPMQNVDGKKIPGAPNGRLAQLAESAHGQSACRTQADADFAALPSCP